MVAILSTFAFIFELKEKKKTYSRSKKRKNPFFNTNYRTEMKLVPIIMDYSLLQFDALQFFLGVRLHSGGFYLTLISSV